MHCFLIFFSSLIVALAIIPPLIKISFKNKMFDEPSEDRKIHKGVVPNSGGIAIFIGFLFSCLILIPFDLLPQANILMAAAMLVFIMGLKDDIDDLKPFKKFIAQFIAAIMVSVFADLRITDLYGVMGIHELSYEVSITFTVFFFVGIVNAYNLIDGIDGLAGGLGVLLSLFYTFLFYQVGQMGYAYLSISLTGALIGFLCFNVTPSKIFMGDSGSLLLGFIVAVLSIKVMDADLANDLMLGSLPIRSSAGLITAVLVIPVFDTLRVFTLRIWRGVSPFTADSNHLHHRLLSLGLNHIQAATILILMNLSLIIMALTFQGLNNTQLIGLIIFSTSVLNGLLSLLIIRQKKFLIYTK